MPLPPLFIPLLLLCYALLNLFTAFYFDSTARYLYTDTLRPQGGIVGPLDVTGENRIIEVYWQQPVELNQWSFISVDLLDQERAYLMGFGEEFWHESGYDSDGAWRQQHSETAVEIRLPEPGDYYLAFESETSSLKQVGDITVNVIQKRGGSLLFYYSAVVSFVIAGGWIYFWYRANR